MANKVKQKRRLRKAIVRRQRAMEKEVLAVAWRNIFVRKGILKG
ncbi:DUF3983 domain-containing protein [Bacillus sp. ISL-7]|nr:DUF3983 domain-containing protein [Bacillus sp. ISL-7]MBT2735162.1 DUF3983 domain-containing protein [Bacillus sp. ISL-7]